MALTDLPTIEIESTPLPVVTDPAIKADIAKFRSMLDQYLDGDLDEDVFRVFRLHNGIYGQRQGGFNQMVRVRMPYGTVTAEQLDMLAFISEKYSRGWGHITTRQNIQMHYIQLQQIPEVLSYLGSVGLSSREACGDAIRNVQGCHLAGACPFEVIDISAWAQATNDYFLRNPLGQRLPRKFKINFSGCDTDCGQAMFNDVGVIAASRTRDDGSTEAGFRVFVAGGLGANPHPALALEDFTAKEDLLPTIESILRVFEQTGNRDNKLRARMKWVVDELGWDETKRRILKTRHLLPAAATWPGGIPELVKELGDAPAGLGGEPTPVGQGVAVRLGGRTDYDRWEAANVVRGVSNGTVSAYAWCELGDITGAQFRGMASIIRELDVDMRVSNRQNFIVRNLREDQLPTLFARLSLLGMAQPGAELTRDVVACPGADTCSLAVTQSRGLGKAIGEQLEAEGLAEVGGVRINISGCMNSCGQHHIADIGFFGAERRAHGQSAPGYQMLLGGYVGQEQIHFGDKALRLPAKNAPEAAARVLRRFVDEREAGEAFRSWMDRAGGAREIAKGLKDLDQFPTPDDDPDFYVDFDETAPFVAEVGESGVRDLSADLDAAIAAIDRANEADPNLIDGRPLARVQGERASAWLVELEESPSGELTVAARAHHLRRWEIVRSEFPEGRDGYLRWRRANKQHQAAVIEPLLDGLDFDQAFRARVAALLLRRGLGSDPETQSLEDVACLVFLETQFEPMLERLDREHLVGVVAKTLKKMSPEAIALASRIALSPAAASILASATTS